MLEDPSRDRFRELLQEHNGETPNLDFKAEWPADDKLVRHILALGNSGGGCIVIGVAERDDKSLEPVGLDTMRDKVDVTKKLNKHLPETLMRNVHVDDFAYDSSDFGQIQGMKFQLVSVIPDAEHLPFLTERSSGDIRVGAVYVRRGTESVEASHDELQRIINQRIATGHSTSAAMNLEDHLDQLQVLQKRIPKTHAVHTGPTIDLSRWHNIGLEALVGKVEHKPNPNYPEEDAQAFIRRMFEAKKVRIARELDVLP